MPRRYRTIAMLVLIGARLTAATGGAALLRAADCRGRAACTSTAAFDLTAHGSLAAWLAAVVLFMASAICLLTYSIRRHRIDDYPRPLPRLARRGAGVPGAQRE